MTATSDFKKCFKEGYKIHQTSVGGRCWAAEVMNAVAPETVVGVKTVRGKDNRIYLAGPKHWGGTKTRVLHSSAPKYASFGIARVHKDL